MLGSLAGLPLPETWKRAVRESTHGETDVTKALQAERLPTIGLQSSMTESAEQTTANYVDAKDRTMKKRSLRGLGVWFFTFWLASSNYPIIWGLVFLDHPSVPL